MSHTPLTQAYFDEMITKLFAVVATKDDFKEVREELTGLRKDVAHLSTSVDKFTADYRKDADERAVFASRVTKIKETLIAKGVATEQELVL